VSLPGKNHFHNVLTKKTNSKLYYAQLHALTICTVLCAVFALAPRYKMHKFRDWLLTGVTLDVKPNVFALEVLSYLAYETVAEVNVKHKNTIECEFV